MKKSAFTLAEVLISIAIICVLAALLFPAFRQAANRAKTTVCVSNLHQIHLAMELYHGDHDAYPPNSLSHPALKPYLQASVLRCPMYDRPGAARRTDYFIHGSNMLVGDEISKCMSIRGPSYPLAHDSNHAFGLGAYRTRRNFFIFVRQNGSVDTVEAEVALAPTRNRPCPNLDFWANF